MKASIYLIICGCCLGWSGIALGQTNLQQYTPSVLLRKGQWEAKHFTNVYTQSKAFDNQLRKQDIDGRQTYLTAINQFMYGLHPKYSVGLDVWVKYVKVTGSQGQRSRVGLTGVGPKIKVAPFKKLPRLALQSTFLFPVTSDTESREPTARHPGLFLEFDRYLWINEAFYDVPLSNRTQLFFRGALWTSFPRNSFRMQPFLETPITAFLNYFPNSRLTTYAVL